MSGLSVIIPSRNEANLIPCVDAIREREASANIIVVDDGLDIRNEGLQPVFFQLKPPPALRRDGVKPFIFARNINIGIRAAGNDDVILCNDDALLQSPGGFMLLQKEAEAHPEYGIIGATTNVTGQQLQWRQNIGLREVPHIAFVCVLIPRRTINQVGYLDERYCIDYGVEDRDYCEAVIRAGLKVGVHDGCFVDHGSLVSSFRGDPRAPKDYSQNYALFRQKWGL